MKVRITIATEGDVVLEQFDVLAWERSRDATEFAGEVREYIYALYSEGEDE